MLRVLIKKLTHKRNFRRIRQAHHRQAQVREAFTLIELLVVIAIIGLLSTIAVASLSSSREKARIAKGQQFSGSIRSGLGYNIVGEWNFNDGSGTTAKDTSGYENDGTIAVGTSWIIDEEQCMNGTCLLFDGASGYVGVTDPGASSIFDLTTAVTMTMWIRPSVMPQVANTGIASKGNNYFMLFPDGQEIRAYFWNGSAHQAITTTDAKITADNWHHVVMVYEPGNFKIYVDGVQKASSSSITDTMITNNAAFLIGSDRGYANRYFNGFIDEVRIYSTAPTMGQIQQNYAEGLERHRDLAMTNGVISN